MQGSSSLIDVSTYPINTIIGNENDRASAVHPNSSYLLNERVKLSMVVQFNDMLMQESACLVGVRTYSTNFAMGDGNDRTLAL